MSEHPDPTAAQIITLVDILATSDPDMIAEVGGKHALAARFATELLAQGNRVRKLLPPMEAEALLLAAARTLRPGDDDDDAQDANTPKKMGSAE